MLIVESLAVAEKIWPDFGAVISIEDASRPEEEHRAFAFPQHHALAKENRLPAHLRLVFDDVDEAYDGYVAPEEHQVRQALEFARVHCDRRLLVHCHAGQCRSAAVALGVIADRLGAGRESDAVRMLLEIRQIAAPNLIVLGLVDAILDRRGALRGAWMAHEEKDEQLLRLRFLRDAYYRSPSP
jgi:predicted protein tyrosine phosphatase